MERQNAPTRLTLKLQTGFDSEKGAPIVSNYSFGNVLATASDQALYDLAVTLASLSAYPLCGITRVDTATLAE